MYLCLWCYNTVCEWAGLSDVYTVLYSHCITGITLHEVLCDLITVIETCHPHEKCIVSLIERTLNAHCNSHIVFIETSRLWKQFIEIYQQPCIQEMHIAIYFISFHILLFVTIYIHEVTPKLQLYYK